MEKKISPLVKIFPLVLLMSVFLTSCIDELFNDSDDDNYSVISFGFVKTTPSNQTFVINLDNGSVVTPVRNAISDFGVSDSDRVMVTFDPSDKNPLTDSTFNYFAKIHNLRKILFKDIVKLTDVSEDSVGNDPIIVREAWLSGKNILNVDLTFYTQGSIHYINLVDNGEGNGVAKPYILELRHNDRGDANSYMVNAIVSFNLDRLKVTGQNKVEFFIRYTDYRGNRIDMPKTFRY